MLGDVNKLLFSKVCWQCPATCCLYTVSAYNFNFHWRWQAWGEGDGMESRLPFKIFSASENNLKLIYSILRRPQKAEKSSQLNWRFKKFGWLSFKFLWPFWEYMNKKISKLEILKNIVKLYWYKILNPIRKKLNPLCGLEALFCVYPCAG